MDGAPAECTVALVVVLLPENPMVDIGMVATPRRPSL
jgi:hypothetical protein